MFLTHYNKNIIRVNVIILDPVVIFKESDTPQREDSPDELSNMEDSNSTTQLLSQSISEASHKSMETSFSESSTGRPRRVGSVGEQVKTTIYYYTTCKRTSRHTKNNYVVNFVSRRI